MSSKKLWEKGIETDALIERFTVGMDRELDLELAKYDVDANQIAGLLPLSGHTITHFTVREEMGIDGKQPIIDELAEEYEGRALVAKVNTEINPKLSQYFKIKSIPTLMFIHKGQLVERFQGLIPKPNLEEILEEYIDAGKQDIEVSS